MIEGPPKLILFCLDHGRPQITRGFRIHGQDGDGTKICVLDPVEVC